MHTEERHSEELHIASLVVHAAAKRCARIAGQIAQLPGAEVHAVSDKGKLVVTLEAPASETISSLVSNIQHMDGVLSAALVYQCADTLLAMNEELPDA